MRFAAWRHHDARDGFEVVFYEGRRFEGTTAAIEYGRPFAVRYVIELDDEWRTRRAEVHGQTGTVVLEGDGDGHWLVDGVPAPHVEGCLDVDLESSALTNAFPVAREAADAPAAYVRAFDLSVQRLEQHYVRLGPRRYDYTSPAFDFRCELVYGDDGLVIDYPGIATRA